MSLLGDLLAHNREFVSNREYEKFETDKFPDKNLAVLACMDARLVELTGQLLADPDDEAVTGEAAVEA